MDIINGIPSLQEGTRLENEIYEGYAFSKIGISHKDRNIPCQDYNGYRFLNSEKVLIIAVADGVGSCKYSHWGAYLAVNNVLTSLERRIQELFTGNLEKINTNILNSIYLAFRDTKTYMDSTAYNADVHEFTLATTLTVAVLDGKNIFYGQVGDSGILVKNKDNTFKLITKLNRGDDNKSIYPLQAGETYWSFGQYNEFTDELIIATDGLLDDYLKNNDKITSSLCRIITNAIDSKLPTAIIDNHINDIIEEEKPIDDLTMVYITTKKA